MPNPYQSNIPRLRDTQFVDLMLRRICNVLLVANPYDAFMLEDDGRVDEKIFQEYAELGLRFPPRFIQVDSQEAAMQTMRNSNIDLIICMPAKASMPENDVFDIASSLKKSYPLVPIVVLTPFSHGITDRMKDVDLSIYEYVFSWLGNTDLLISIIKLIEDHMNLDHDVNAGVQMILVVEDNIRFYSSILPNLYKFVLQQSQNFATEALNATLETLRMRGRPKIVLARNYEEAWELYHRYAGNTLGVISDCRFPMQAIKGANPTEEEKDPEAGFKLLEAIRKNDAYIPLIMNSAESANQQKAFDKGYHYIDKNSKKMDVDLRDMVRDYFGFGDFVFRDPTTKEEVIRVHNLKELQDNIFKIPNGSLLYHLKRNGVSRWLCSRALFPISEFLKGITWTSMQDVDAHRQIIFDAIVSYRKMKNQGVVATFQRERFDQYSDFARIGDGSLGGKGRGLAFLDRMLTRHEDLQGNIQLNDGGTSEAWVTTCIPKTVVLCTDVFDEFMDQNMLYQTALGDASDEDILKAFLRGHLPDRLLDDLEAFMKVVEGPIAVRSSSLLEDSHYQPFAGIYSTYMIPYESDKYRRMELLAKAVKSVYASVFYRSSKDYMTATSNFIDQEKMAVILQEVVGQQHGSRFYPVISGVARSVNYYPINDEEADEGTVSLAFGLGKYIVDGGVSLRVCPSRPAQILQMSEMEIALRDTQTGFLALDLDYDKTKDKAGGDYDFKVDDGFNLRRFPIREAEADGTLPWVCSTFDPESQCIYDGYYEGRNRKLISMAGVLQNGMFPLPELLQKVLRYGQEEMRRPVEIEFAVNLHRADDGSRYGEFHLLQIRPMVDNRLSISQDLSQISDADCLMHSHSAIGYGIVSDVADVVYVKTADFSAAKNTLMVDEIEKINRSLLDEGRRCILVGPGRWGSSDPWLGIPVKWPNISSARVIIESGLDGYQVDPSQGTHFFQNLTSLGVCYMTINAYRGEGCIRQDILDKMPALEETEHLRHVRFQNPLTVMVDGVHREGVVLLEADAQLHP